MHPFLHSISQLLSHSPWLAMVVIFLGTTSEAVPFLGNLLLGLTVMTAGSALVVTHHLPLWALAGGAFGGAIAGDALMYHVGLHFHEAIWTWPRLKRFIDNHPQTMARSAALFKRWGAWSVATGRFIPGTRSFVALLAGVYRVPVWPFYLSNIVSGCLWAAAHIVVVLIAMQALHF